MKRINIEEEKNVAYSDSLYSIPPEGFRFDDPKLNDGSGRNRTGVTLLSIGLCLLSGFKFVSSNDLFSIDDSFSGEPCVDLYVSGMLLY